MKVERKKTSGSITAHKKNIVDYVCMQKSVWPERSVPFRKESVKYSLG
jgi:hypothetical protein